MRDTVTIYVPEGYNNPREFLDDCGFESLSVGPENVAAFNDGYAAGLEDRDEKLPRSAAMTASPPNDALKPPFEIYHDKTCIADANGHVLTAESLEIAEALLARLNAAPTTSPEPDAVREALQLGLDAVNESFVEGMGHEEMLLAQARHAAITAALSRPAHGGWEELRALFDAVGIYQFSPTGTAEASHAARDLDDAMDAAKAALARNDRGREAR